MAVSLILSVAMSATEFFIGCPSPKVGELGLCVPSPNLWGIEPLTSWGLNLLAIIGIGVAMLLLNKKYGVVRSTDTVSAAAFLILCGSNTWVDGLLTSSVLICGANLLCLAWMFDTFRSREGMKNMFLVASTLSIGSMMQYGLVFFIPAYLLIATFMKSLNLRAGIAFLLGLIAPYWVGLGLGLISLESFRMPELLNLFENIESRQSLLMGLLNCGVTALLGIILMLYNAVKLYVGNIRRRVMNTSLLLLGGVSVLCMLIDINNIHSYIVTLYMVVGFQIANLFDVHVVKHAGFWTILFTLLYILSFLLMGPFSISLAG